MENYFHNYDFKIEKVNESIEKTFQNIMICKDVIDGEINLFSKYGYGNYTLYLQNRFFNFNIDNTTKYICGFDANLNFTNIQLKQLTYPKIVDEKILKLNTNDNLEQGCGGYIEFNVNQLYYDKNKKILQIGEIINDEKFYKFFSNAYAQINNNKITGLLITELEL